MRKCMCALDMCACAFACLDASAHIPQRSWMSEDNHLCLSSPSTSFMTGTLVHHCVCQLSWACGLPAIIQSPLPILEQDCWDYKCVHCSIHHKRCAPGL